MIPVRWPASDEKNKVSNIVYSVNEWRMFAYKETAYVTITIVTMVKMDVEVVNLLINKSFYFCIFVSVTGRSCIVVQQNGSFI